MVTDEPSIVTTHTQQSGECDNKLPSMATDPPLVTCDSTGTMSPAATSTCSTHQRSLCSFFANLIVPENQVPKSTQKYRRTGRGESIEIVRYRMAQKRKNEEEKQERKRKGEEKKQMKEQQKGKKEQTKRKTKNRTRRMYNKPNVYA